MPSEYFLHLTTHVAACITFSNILAHSCFCTPVYLNMDALAHQLMKLYANMCPGPPVHLHPIPSAHFCINHLSSSTFTHLHACASDLNMCASEYMLHRLNYAAACCTFSSIMAHSCVCAPVSQVKGDFRPQLMQLHAYMCPDPLVHLHPTPAAHSCASHSTSSTLTHLPSHASID